MWLGYSMDGNGVMNAFLTQKDVDDKQYKDVFVRREHVIIFCNIIAGVQHNISEREVGILMSQFDFCMHSVPFFKKYGNRMTFSEGISKARGRSVQVERGIYDSRLSCRKERSENSVFRH